MFVGYQKIKVGEHTETRHTEEGDIEVIVPDYENQPKFIAETQEELEDMPCVVLEEIQEHDFAEMYDGKVYTSEEELNAKKNSDEVKKQVADAHKYLEDTDYVCNKIVEGVATKEDYADILAKREEARELIRSLEN